MSETSRSPLSVWPRSWILLALAASSSAVAADLFFYGHPLGWTAGAYLLLLIVWVVLRSWRARQARSLAVLLPAVLGLVFALVESPTRFNMACAIAAIGTFALAIRLPPQTGIASWLGRWGVLLVAPLTRPLHDAGRIAHWVARHPRSAAKPLRTAGLWLLPIVFGSIFVAIFTIANPIVEQWITKAFDWLDKLLKQLDLLVQPDRMALWLFAALITYALLRVSRRRRRSGSAAIAYSPLPTPTGLARLLETAIVTRCLLVFNLVFAVETFLDLIYLWGGRTLPAGLNYKEYAHRGAFPLIATALLAGVFVLVTFRNDANTKDSRVARWLVYAWIAQNVLLTLSAAWRLWLYVDVSLLTRLRLAASIWLLLVVAGLVSLIWRIVRRRDNAWLIRVNSAMAAIVLYACCFMNYDGFIASWNAGHCDFLRHGTTAESLSYFGTLGEESLPALRRLQPMLDTPEARSAAGDLIADLNSQLSDELDDWRGWTVRRARLQAQFPAPPEPVRTAYRTARASQGRRGWEWNRADRGAWSYGR